MTHRTRFMISAAVPTLAVIVLVVAAPGTNSQFTDTDTGTTNITFSNDPDQYSQPEVAEPTPLEPTTAPEVGEPQTQPEIPTEESPPSAEPTPSSPPEEVEDEPTPEEPSIETTPSSPTPTPEEGDTNDEEGTG